jgi:hypothetical protein
MTTDDDKKFKVGDRRGIYRVVELNVCGSLPLAVIEEGNVNAGVQVILTTPFKDTPIREASPA